jgi:hypothetical protein
MSSYHVCGSYSISVSGASPNVVYQLAAIGYQFNQNTVYHTYPLDQQAGFTFSAQIFVGSGSKADSMFVFFGSTGGGTASYVSPKPVTTALTGQTYGGFMVYIDIWREYVDNGLAAPRIYLIDSQNIVVASAAFSVGNQWESLQIQYQQGSINTWTVSWKGAVVISYSDASNAAWVRSLSASQSPTVWGFGAATGEATAMFAISQVQVDVIRPSTPSASKAPSQRPTLSPSFRPSPVPISIPTTIPTLQPTITPTRVPSFQPTTMSTFQLSSAGTATVTFTSTGSLQFFVVPPGVTSLQIQLWAAGGELVSRWTSL